MTLYKRGRIWWVTYQVDGVRHQRSCKTASRKAAELWIQNIKTARKMPSFADAVEVLRTLYREPDEGGIALGHAWTQYTEIASATGKDAISPRTLRERRQYFDRFASWIAREAATVRTVEGVTGPIAAKFAAQLRANGLKAQTRRNIIGGLSTIWKMLGKVSARVANPWTDLSPRDTDGTVGKAFSPADEKKVLAAAESVGKDWLPVCILMRHTGLRYSDVARLKWSDINGDVIRLTPSKTKRHNIQVAIPLTAVAREAVRKLDRRGDFLFPVHEDVWTNRSGPGYASLNFREVLRAAGLDGSGYTIHSWRHTAATRLAETGAPIETRKRILGHREDLTAERYDHAEHLAEVRAAMEAASGVSS